MIFRAELAERFTSTDALLSSHHMGNNCCSCSGKSRWKWYLTKCVGSRPVWHMSYTGLSRCPSPLAHTKDLMRTHCGCLLACLHAWFPSCRWISMTIQRGFGCLKHYTTVDGQDMHQDLKVWKHPRPISLNTVFMAWPLSMCLKREPELGVLHFAEFSRRTANVTPR